MASNGNLLRLAAAMQFVPRNELEYAVFHSNLSIAVLLLKDLASDVVSSALEAIREILRLGRKSHISPYLPNLFDTVLPLLLDEREHIVEKVLDVLDILLAPTHLYLSPSHAAMLLDNIISIHTSARFPIRTGSLLPTLLQRLGYIRLGCLHPPSAPSIILNLNSFAKLFCDTSSDIVKHAAHAFENIASSNSWVADTIAAHDSCIPRLLFLVERSVSNNNRFDEMRRIVLNTISSIVRACSFSGRMHFVHTPKCMEILVSVLQKPYHYETSDIFQHLTDSGSSEALLDYIASFGCIDMLANNLNGDDAAESAVVLVNFAAGSAKWRAHIIADHPGVVQRLLILLQGSIYNFTLAATTLAAMVDDDAAARMRMALQPGLLNRLATGIVLHKDDKTAVAAAEELLVALGCRALLDASAANAPGADAVFECLPRSFTQQSLQSPETWVCERGPLQPGGTAADATRRAAWGLIQRKLLTEKDRHSLITLLQLLKRFECSANNPYSAIYRVFINNPWRLF